MKILKKKKWKFNCENKNKDFKKWKIKKFDCENHFSLNEFLFV